MSRGLKTVKYRRDDALSRVKWDRLEVLVADYYRSCGYDIEHCGTGGTHGKFDGGIDLRLRKDGEYLLVQCKHWNAYKVAHNDVHQLLGLVVNEEATGGILVTSGEFTKAAIEAAARQGRIQLIDGDELRQMIGPLPEEPATAARGSGSSAASTAGAFAANAAERLIAAAEDRVRHGGGGIPRRVAKTAADALLVMLFKFAFASVLLLLLFIGMNKMLRSITEGFAARTGRPRAEAIRAPVEPQASPARGLPVAGPTPMAKASPARGVADVGGMTEADLREWRRKNAESMKVLEATTRELPRAPTAVESQQ